MKKISLFVYASILVVLLSGCFFYKPWEGKRPCDQKGTTWVSENNEVTFSINKNGLGKGKITIDDKEVDVYVDIGPATQIVIYPAENRETSYFNGQAITGFVGDPVEMWSGDFKRSDRFTAEIRETTYFKEGDTITFYRKD